MKDYWSIQSPESKDHRKAWAIGLTLATHLALAALLLLGGWTIPFPPPPEKGILVNFGDSETGSGLEEPAPISASTTAQAQASEAAKSDARLTQDFEDAPALKAENKKKKDQPKTPQAQQEKRIQSNLSTPITEPIRQVNQRALFSGKGTSASAGEGEGRGQGNQGVKEGVANAPHGIGGGTGNGSIRGLSGRSVIGQLPKPQYIGNNSGTVAVAITVDRAGNVTSARAGVQGSTTQDDALLKAAERAALRAKFTSSEESVQAGVILYHFKMQN